MDNINIIKPNAMNEKRMKNIKKGVQRTPLIYF
jgi:hypothetical protein